MDDLYSGPPLKGVERSKALAAKEMVNHRSKKMTEANALLSYGNWTDHRYVEQGEIPYLQNFC